MGDGEWAYVWWGLIQVSNCISGVLSNVFLLFSHFPQPLTATREITSVQYILLTIFLIHKIAQHLPASIMYFYLFCLFTLTNIRKSECLIVLLLCGQGLYLTYSRQLSGRKTGDTIMTMASWALERQRATILLMVKLEWQLLCICCRFIVFSPHLGSDYLKIEL